MKIKTNLVVSIVYQFLAVIYGFILPRLVLQQYGSEVNGLIQSIAQFLGFIGFLDMGVGQVVRSALYQPLERQDHEQLSLIMVSGRKFYRRIAYALLGYVVALIGCYPLFVNKSFDWFFAGTMIAIIAIGSFSQYCFGIIPEQLLHASQNSYLVYSIQSLCCILNIVVCVIMIRMNCSIHALKLVTAIIYLIKPAFYTWCIHRKWNINWRITYKEEPIRQKWYGVAQHISAVVLEGTDNIILTLFTTLSHVSVYSVYYMIVTNLHGFYQIAVTGIQSAAGAAWAKQEQADIRRLFSLVEVGLHAATVFLFCCTGILIIPFVQVYTIGLTDADYIQPIFAAILVLAYGIRCLRTPYNIWILAAGRFKQTQRCHIIAAVLNLVISILAVSRWGLIGVAIGTLITMCYQTTWMMLYTTRKLVKVTIKHVFRQLIADATAVVFVFIATSSIVLEDINYLSWFIMAVKVALITIACIAVVTLIFHARKIKQVIAFLLASKSSQ